MSHELICSCLQLSPDHWPPNHYTLLGLEPGEVELSRIEHCAQERMERLRRYQLTHAEQVTEGMNRLAQALVCLTDPVARKAYDAKLFPRPAKRTTVPADFRWSIPTEEESGLEQPFRSRVSSPWLLLAWILWLSVGVAGLGAAIFFFPAIQASYYGEPKKLEPAKKVTPKASRSTLSERRPPQSRE
jgi:hypothetical protein